jgi:UvrB/uvrC motif.
MFSEGLIEHFMGDKEYVSVRDIAGEDVLKLFAMQAAQDNPQVEYTEDLIDDLMRVAERVYIKFPKDGERREDLPEIDPNEVSEFFKGEWGSIKKRLTREIGNRAEEEFPIIVDLARAQGITFGYKFEDKEENLSAAMDFFVEQENYEMAAKVRDELDRMGSNAVKQQ